MYLAVQVALRDALTGVAVVDAVSTLRATAGPTLTRAAEAAGAEVDVAVREVLVRDVILPSDLRTAYAELVTGKQRALLQLEQALTVASD